ncbi:hypothetical protein [Siccirubricoccus phaeus]|uniref:hypothetical protein n=1 Tax=Siccirubricoccus phaeus TaxID=2595053 RepID=UPI0011F1EDF5|nr:hypothetical protein [Siccirubricoccus phaeus]
MSPLTIPPAPSPAEALHAAVCHLGMITDLQGELVALLRDAANAVDPQKGGLFPRLHALARLGAGIHADLTDAWEAVDRARMAMPEGGAA